MSFLFSILIGVAEKLFASELAKYLEAFHAQKKATEIANAPTTKDELVGSFNSN